MKDYNPIIVTGAAGFIGSCVVHRLLQEGGNVHLMLRAETNIWRLQDVLNQVTIHQADLRDGQGTRTSFEKICPGAVLHLAAHGAYEWQSDARQILETNVLGTYHVLEAALAVRTRVFINTGSSSEYGYKREPMSELDRLEPNSIYSISKAAQTHLCNLLSKGSSTDIVSFRLFSVYGPWEEPARLLPTIVRRARAGLPLEMSSPDLARDFIYVDDVLDALLAFDRLSEFNGEVFNLGTGIESTLRDVVRIVQEIVGCQSEVHWGSLPARKWDSDKWRADITKARSLLGWSPHRSLAEGIRSLAQWLTEHEDDYKRIESHGARIRT